jgi:predicted unusual protein kinase regulating ubiquinone biosynthesis (AarF/ABC1/UbiB family)
MTTHPLHLHSLPYHLQVTDQLSQLFRMGFVHADLKWQNVLVRIHPTKKTITDVTVADFGALTCLGKEVAVSVK